MVIGVLFLHVYYHELTMKIMLRCKAYIQGLQLLLLVTSGGVSFEKTASEKDQVTPAYKLPDTVRTQ